MIADSARDLQTLQLTRPKTPNRRVSQSQSNSLIRNLKSEIRNREWHEKC